MRVRVGSTRWAPKAPARWPKRSTTCLSCVCLASGAACNANGRVGTRPAVPRVRECAGHRSLALIRPSLRECAGHCSLALIRPSLPFAALLHPISACTRSLMSAVGNQGLAALAQVGLRHLSQLQELYLKCALATARRACDERRGDAARSALAACAVDESILPFSGPVRVPLPTPWFSFFVVSLLASATPGWWAPRASLRWPMRSNTCRSCRRSTSSARARAGVCSRLRRDRSRVCLCQSRAPSLPSHSFTALCLCPSSPTLCVQAQRAGP